MKITALAPWFGAKRNMSRTIADELGKHSAYWEPFCGSMAVLLEKDPCSMETVNDLHGDLINLARTVRDPLAGVSLWRKLRRTLCTKDFLDEAAERCKSRGNGPATSEPDIDRAYDFFVASWLGRNGVSGTHSYNQGFCRRFTKNGGHAATRFNSAIASIPAWRRRMRNVVVLSECGISLCDRIEDAAGVVIYCDPPYLVKGAKYVHDFGAVDHERLAASLARFKKTRVVVSYYDHPLLDSLYLGWTKRRIKATKAMVNQGMRDKKGSIKAPEVLLINGPSFVDSLPLDGVA